MPKLSVLVPAYNEKATLEELLSRLKDVPIDKEIILIDDASTDGTRELIRDRVEGKVPGLKVIYHDKNRGKGSAIREGLALAQGDIVVIQDADLEYDPQDLVAICRAFEAPGVEVVYGTRFSDMNAGRFIIFWLKNKFLGHQQVLKRFHHYFGVMLLNVIANILYDARVTDEATCYKAFRRSVFNDFKLDCKGFEFCPEVTAKVRKTGRRIVEVPVSYQPRTKTEGKKINWRHGVEAIATLLKYRFTD